MSLTPVFINAHGPMCFKTCGSFISVSFWHPVNADASILVMLTFALSVNTTVLRFEQSLNVPILTYDSVSELIVTSSNWLHSLKASLSILLISLI